MKKSLLWIIAFCFWTSAAVAEPAAVDSARVYSIQLFAYSRQPAADGAVESLKSKGLDAYVTTNQRGLFVVRTGSHGSRLEARQAAEQLQKNKLIGSFLIVSGRAPDTAEVAARTSEVPTAEVSKTVSAAREPAAAAQETATVPRVATDPDTGTPKSTADTGTQAVADKKSAGSQMIAALEAMAHQPIAPQPPGFRAARIALDFLGVKYRWGGMSVETGMDCSGFVKTVYALCGINLPRTSAEQYRQGEPVARNELSPGDMVFFGNNKRVNHVGIYLGEGKFIHAPRSRKTIRISNLEESSLRKKFLGARRLLFNDK